jgi:hypothetical protein
METMTTRLLAMLITFALLASDTQAGRRGYYSGGGCSGGNCGVPTAMPVSNCPGGVCPAPVATTTAPIDCPNGNCAASVPTTPKAAPAVDPLAQVNARRAAAGLRPYQHDPALTTAARSAATYRARYRIRGHVIGGMGDFQFVPPGTQATAAGCAAWPPGDGFGSCAMYDSYTFAGAASVQGEDGLVYHHLFVR